MGFQTDMIKQLGSLQIIPGTSNAINSFVDNVTGETSKVQNEKIRALEAEVAAGKKTQQQAAMEARSTGMKKGGKVSESSHKKALGKAGFYDKGKTKSEREKIVSKVTTKPQRLGMVEKLFSAKKMKSGGMASQRADGIAIRGKTKA